MLKRLLKFIALALYRTATVGLDKGPHITRYKMYEHLAKYAEERPANQKVLTISHSQNLARLMGFTDNQITDASYPEFNALNLPFADGEFDAVISDQVLEHIEGDPQIAIDEMFRVLKPNGICLHTTCFINPIHEDPHDYWRFTPNALKLLTIKHGEIVDVGGWGNPYVWAYASFGLRFEPIPKATWHPAHWLATMNNPFWPISTWVLAKRKLVKTK